MTETKKTIAALINIICWAIIGVITGMYVPMYLLFLVLLPLAVLSLCMQYLLDD